MRDFRRAFLAVLITAVAASPARAHKPITSRYTFAGDVSPIIQARCAPCHRPGGPAPMPLETYEEVRPWAQAIQERVLDGTMPPWFAEPGHEPLVAGQPLTAREVDALADWVAGGAPAGEIPPGGGQPARAELRASPESGLEVRSVPLEASGGLVPLADDHHLAAWWIEPRDGPFPAAAVLHVEPPAGAAAAPAGSWTAGQGPFRLPDGAAFRIPAGSTLRLEVFPGRAARAPARGGARITLRLGLLGRAPRSEARAVVLESRAAIELPSSARLAAVMPLGDGGPARLVLRGGEALRERTILEVSRASAEWPVTYSFASPPAIGHEGSASWEPIAGAGPSRLVLIYAAP